MKPVNEAPSKAVFVEARPQRVREFLEQNGTEIRLRATQEIEKMVARDGVEPPTPAFSGLKLTVIAST
jgi:hypothetical protein